MMETHCVVASVADAIGSLVLIYGVAMGGWQKTTGGNLG